MAAKKFYAVRKGKITGVFLNWADCKASVDGYPGAEYKGFATLEEANAFIGNESKMVAEDSLNSQQDYVKISKNNKCLDKECLLTYVDGSYDDSIKKYAFGCVFILDNGCVYTEYGNGDNPQSLQHRNVTGEMLGAMYAVRVAMLEGYKAVEICYDYEGIEKWVTGAWRSKTELTQKYTASMREWNQQIGIKFTKVAAHTKVKYNELADQTAKKGLTEASGVPKVRKIEEMTLYKEV